jgi:hypothetical protein
MFSTTTNERNGNSQFSAGFNNATPAHQHLQTAKNTDLKSAKCRFESDWGHPSQPHVRGVCHSHVTALAVVTEPALRPVACGL